MNELQLPMFSDAPTATGENDEEIKKFIESVITCELPDKKSCPDLHQLVNKYQKHKCSRSCIRRIKTKKGYRTICRFGFPRPRSYKVGVYILLTYIYFNVNVHVLKFTAISVRYDVQMLH